MFVLSEYCSLFLFAIQPCHRRDMTNCSSSDGDVAVSMLEKYLIEFSVKSYITLAKFRTTNNRLPIEKGRWDNIERNQRFCPLCNCYLIGDEFHYLFQCEFFKDSRQTYFKILC